MSKQDMLEELRLLERRAETIRTDLGISPPARVTFVANRDAIGDEMVVVEADGFGGATVSLVEGNYPVDFLTTFEKFFQTEEEADAAAERVAFEGASPTEVLGVSE